jgi:hypothetical protein
MITSTSLNTAALGLQAAKYQGSDEAAAIRGHFEQVFQRVQVQPLRILPSQARAGSAPATLAQQMQREGLI